MHALPRRARRRSHARRSTAPSGHDRRSGCRHVARQAERNRRRCRRRPEAERCTIFWSMQTWSSAGTGRARSIGSICPTTCSSSATRASSSSSSSAWGHTGPWAARRGFDSVVQAPTGIAASESADGETPGALPCQLLDHGTGYLAAAAVLDGVRRQMLTGGTHVRRLSLARTAAWLTARPPVDAPRPDSVDDDPRPWLQVLRHGRRSDRRGASARPTRRP